MNVITQLERDIAAEARARKLRLSGGVKPKEDVATTATEPAAPPPLVIQPPEPVALPTEQAIAEVKHALDVQFARLKALKHQADHFEIANSIPEKAVILTVCQFYGITYQEIVSQYREQAVATPRHIAMYLLRVVGLLSFEKIGRAFGSRDHSTAVHAKQKIERLIQTDPALAADVAKLRSLLEARNV